MQGRVLEEVEVEIIVVSEQVRKVFCPEELAGLTQSVCEQGILVPLLGHSKGDAVCLDDGERRLRAAMAVGLKRVPVLIDSRDLGRAEVLQRQLVTAVQKGGLRPLEQARGFADLRAATGWSQEDLARALGMRASTVSKRLKLLELSNAVQERLERGEITASVAYHIATVKCPEAQLRLAEEAASGDLRRDEVAEKAKRQ